MLILLYTICLRKKKCIYILYTHRPFSVLKMPLLNENLCKDEHNYMKTPHFALSPSALKTRKQGDEYPVHLAWFYCEYQFNKYG